MQENLQLGCEEECDKIGTKTSEKKLDGENASAAVQVQCVMDAQ
jgi:hypothetical protein